MEPVPPELFDPCVPIHQAITTSARFISRSLREAHVESERESSPVGFRPLMQTKPMQKPGTSSHFGLIETQP